MTWPIIVFLALVFGAAILFVGFIAGLLIMATLDVITHLLAARLSARGRRA